MENGREGFEIDIQKLLKAYLKRWWVILLCGIIGATLSFVYTAKFITPLYSASVTLYVNNYGWKGNQDADFISGTNLTTAQQLVNTYVSIIRSNAVLEEVLEKADLEYTAKEIRGMMSASQVGDTEMFTITISNPDPTEAAQIANAIADVAPIKITEYVEGSSTKIVDYAKVPTDPYTPNYKTNVLKGFLVGVMIAVVAVTVAYMMDFRIKDASDLESAFDLPILGQIPDFSDVSIQKKRNGKGGYYGRDKGKGYGYGYGYESAGRSDSEHGEGDGEK